MLRGVDTPKIDIPFFITIDKACKSTSLQLLGVPFTEINLKSLFSLPRFQYAWNNVTS